MSTTDTPDTPDRNLDYAVYGCALPSGDCEVILVSTARSVGGVPLLLTEILVDRFGASKDDVEALKARVAPHLQEAWAPHCRSDSWIGAVHGGYDCARSAIEAMGTLTLRCEDRSDPGEDEYESEAALKARTHASWAREIAQDAHEGMHLQALGYKLSGGREKWALDHVHTL